MSSQQQQQQHKRAVEQQDDGEHANGTKRSRAANGNIEVKQERAEAAQGAEGAAEGALMLVEAMEEPQINLLLSVSHLHCRQCLRPLKPPTFKCEARHAVCRSCRDNHAQVCAGAGTFVPCPLLDGIVCDSKVSCPHEAFGCTAVVVYHEASDHPRSCRFAPCLCPVPGCQHFTSPARLVEHFSTHHAWSTTEVDYAKPCKVAVPGPEDKHVLVSKADGSVFLMLPYALGAAGTAVALVCVRACGDAAVAPQYTCKVWAEVPGNTLLLTFDVASSDLAGGFPAIDQVMYLALPRLLYGESGEPPVLRVRIDKVGASATRSRSLATTPPTTRSSSPAAAAATPPSSLPSRMLQ